MMLILTDRQDIDAELLKALPSGSKFANQPGYYFDHNGNRWHKFGAGDPVPKGAPIAAHPHAAGQHAPAKHWTDEQWGKLKLPAENVNASSHNKKLDQIRQLSEGGHVSGLLGMQYGVNTYGKIHAKIANELLKKHGILHQVAPGQGAGEHDAVGEVPAPAVKPFDHGKFQQEEASKPAEPEQPAAAPMESSDKSGLKAPPTPKIADFNFNQVAKTWAKMFEAGEHDKLAASIEKLGHSATVNPGLASHPDTLALAKYGKELLGKMTAAKEAAAPVPEPEKPAEAAETTGPKEGDTKPGADGGTLVLKDGHWVKQGGGVSAADPNPGSQDDAKAEQNAKQQENPELSQTGQLTAKQLSNLQSIPWFKLKLPESNTNAATVNKKLQAIQDAAFAGNVAQLHAMKFGSNTYGKKLALLTQTALAGLKEGAAVPVADSDPLASYGKYEVVPAAVSHKMLEAAGYKLAPMKGLMEYTIKVPGGTKSGAVPKDGVAKDQLLHLLEQAKVDIPNLSALNTAFTGVGSKTAPEPTAPVEPVKPAETVKEPPSAANVTELTKEQIAGLHKWMKAGQPSNKHPDSWSNLWKKLTPEQKSSVKSVKAEPSPAAPVAPPPSPPVPEPKTDDKKTHVAVKAAHLENTSNGHNKHYSVSVHGSKVMTAWGAIGKNKHVNTSVLDAGSPEAAQKVAALIIAKKKTNGYEPAGTTVHNHEVDPGASKPDETLVDGWKAAIASGKVPTKEQADHVEGLMDADPTASMEHFMDAVNASIPKHLMDDDSIDAAIEEYTDKAHALHGKALKSGGTGPKDGDTKPAADGGTLVFKDGHWHKQDEPQPVPAQASAPDPAGPQPKKLTPNEVKALGAGLKTASGMKEKLKAMAVAGNVAGLQKFIQDNPKLPASKALAKKMIDAMMAGASSEPKLVLPKKVKPAAAPSAEIESIDGWSKDSGTQGGYTDGAFFTDSSGQKWYCKFHGAGEEAARAEVLALKLYQAAGQNTPEMKLIQNGGKIGTASKVIHGLKQDRDALQSGSAHAIFSGFGADAWLANWDTVGNNPAAGKGWDNIQFRPDGKAYRIDAGGALHFKGAGGKKSASEWSDEVIETKTLLDPKVNANTAKAFGKMTEADKKASVAKVLAVSDDTIKQLVKESGSSPDVAAKLIARKQSLAKQFQDVAAKVAAKPSPAKDMSWLSLKTGEKVVESGDSFGGKWAKIEVPAMGFDPAGLPKPYVYNKSSSKFVNDQNTLDLKAIHDLASSGAGHAAVAAIKFPQIDKATGVKSGKMLSIDEHPSKAYVKEYLNQVVAELKAQTQPTYRTVTHGSFAASYSSAAASIAAKVKTLAHSAFSSWKDKAADYLVLDRHVGNGIPAPTADAFKNVEPTDPKMQAFKAASDANFAKLTSAEKSACVSYTGNAFWNWNSALRLGEVGSSHFKNAQPMVNAFHKAAVELPDGITLHRGLGVGGQTYASVIGAVIQDGSFQSTSYGAKAAFSGHKTQLRIHVSKGVKGMMATSFSKYGTGEREIILHPNTRYLVLKTTESDGKTFVDVLALPHEN